MTKFEKAVHILDMFCKEFCIKRESTDLKFECNRCPFENKETKECAVKVFKQRFDPEYKDFGSMIR